MSALSGLAPQVGVRSACAALDFARATYYREKRRCAVVLAPVNRPRPALALADAERDFVLAALNSERFMDQTPREVYATLLDEGVYHCSVRTMYRLLDDQDQVRERRNQLTRPHYQKPELLATGPNQVWSWDITKLKGPRKWTYFYLYVLIDIFSRYVVGWLVADAESAALAKQLVAETCEKQAIEPDQLYLHADRGPSMTSKALAFLLADLGVTKSHSRPHVSNDNPFSEAGFKTLKYRPDFPECFGCLEDARAFCRDFFSWYNREHHHTGLALLTPAMVHHGQAAPILSQRQAVLDAAHTRHPARFKGKRPTPGTLPEAVWINPPSAHPESGETHAPLLTLDHDKQKLQ